MMSVSAPQEVVARKVMGADEPARPRRLTGTSVLVGGFLILTCLAMLSPIVWTAASVTKPTDVAFLNPPVFTWQPTLDTFVDLWQTTNFYQYVINTLVVAVISTVFALVLGLPAAYALSRAPGWISTVLLIVALIFRALPRFAVVLPMYDMARAVGLYDTPFALALALVAINQPFTIWLLRNFFADIPTTLDEAAMMDGCSRYPDPAARDDSVDGAGHSHRGHLRLPVRLPGVPHGDDPHRRQRAHGARLHRHSARTDVAHAPTGGRRGGPLHDSCHRFRVHRPEVHRRRTQCRLREGLT